MVSEAQRIRSRIPRASDLETEERLVRTLIPGDYIYLQKEHVKYTPRRKGGPVEVINIMTALYGQSFQFNFSHIEATRSGTTSSLKIASCRAIDIPRTNAWLSYRDKQRELNTKAPILTIPILPDL